MNTVTTYFKDGRVEVHEELVYSDACAYADKEWRKDNVLKIVVKG